MKKKGCFLILLVLLAVFSACSKDTGEEQSFGVYQLNKEETRLDFIAYQLQAESLQEQINEVIQQYGENPGVAVTAPVLPQEVEIIDFSLSDEQLYLNFNQAYTEMDSVREMFVRTAMVRTFTQLSGIAQIGIRIEGLPLTDVSGQPLGLMENTDLLEYTGEEVNSYKNATLILYFANQSGDKLVCETLDVRYASSIALEKLVIEQLLGGPRSEALQATIPADTGILGVLIKDGICYVNLDENFLEPNYDLRETIPIYSVVNSICDTCDVEEVQISINGQTASVYRDTVAFDQLFRRNADLIAAEEVVESDNETEASSGGSTINQDAAVGIEAMKDKLGDLPPKDESDSFSEDESEEESRERESGESDTQEED